jgi:hypothetical protein
MLQKQRDLVALQADFSLFEVTTNYTKILTKNWAVNKQPRGKTTGY